ncbi:MAG: CAP domain-containing protein, partial [Eubacterium sp.]|nr:CAP domain-containing protein [Eubacterium sp.]
TKVKVIQVCKTHKKTKKKATNKKTAKKNTQKETTTKVTEKNAQKETVGSEEQQYIEKIVQLVNKERKSAGLNAVQLDETLTKAAMTRAKETNISFSHTRPDGTSFSTVLSQYKISYRGAGENIAWGQQSPDEVMRGWMNSSGHRANILNKNFKKIGVGYYKVENGRKYWSQLFIY